ncbi:hypothetical protein OC845_001666 [Tilletia horrida]|nr:hypothetical protein OC845_001666 [Tilletia horrida]
MMIHSTGAALSSVLVALLYATSTASAAPASAGQIVLSTNPDPGFGSTADARRRIAASRFDAASSIGALKAKYNNANSRLFMRSPGAASSSHSSPSDTGPLFLHRRRRLDQEERDQEEHDKRLLGLVGGLLNGVSSTLNGVVGALGTVLFDGQWGIALASTSNQEADNEWLTTLGIGTPTQQLQVVLDTGSPDTWVYSPSCCYQRNHNFFNPLTSLTYANRTVQNGQAVRAAPGTPGQSWSITYGNGYSGASGYVGIDNLTIGDSSNLSNPPLTAAALPVALLTGIQGTSRANRQMEGLVGLTPGFTSDTDGGWTTIMEKLITDGKVANPYLSATLTRANRTTGTGGGGRYIFGAVDTAAVRSGQSVAWINVTSTYYWGTNYQTMRVGNVDIVPSSLTPNLRRVIIDTGSALMNLPSPIASGANKQIAGSWYDNTNSIWVIPCQTGESGYEATTQNPSYWLDIAGSSFGVAPVDYVFSPNTPIWPANATSSTSYCYSAFQVGPDAISIIGGTFLKNHMVTFDWGPPPFRTRRMGFANRTDVAI